jgi:predicted metalloprotease
MPRTEIRPDKSKIRLRKLDQNAERFTDKAAYEKRLKNLQ